MMEYVDVVAAVIRRQDGAILISRRAGHQHQGGKWEFPGGKVEAGESHLLALSRELQEELGIHCNLAQPLMTVEHDYSDKAVRLHFFDVDDWLGNAEGREGQKIDWVMPAALCERDFPAANQPLVTALIVGSRLLVWPDAPPAHWEVRLHLALQRGVSLVYMRGVTDETILTQAAAICRQDGARLLVANDVALMERVGAHGLHLTSAVAAETRQRPATPLLSVACHSKDEIHNACQLQADLAVLSPVNETASHTDATPLGWKRVAELASGLPLPVFALGGVGPGDLPQARMHGAFGVAGISAFWPPAQLLHHTDA